MGLNVGVRVKQQPEGYMQVGNNPKGTLEEIAQRLQDHLEAEMGGGGFNVHVDLRDGWYIFDARVFGYGRDMPEGKSSYDLTGAVVLWAWGQFSDEEGVEMRTYWNG